ncbi:sensor of ECF-type sigma factor [Oceanihabitans sp. 2_MG-2023]|uniref:sensor of ECF-type sigma factor n=1 Tax=Oceanihabitans sp. 2_MG-2023 TaxID=3062661 RepID=UPI0026E197D2|nr:sensor of ECF-type sigma factor [Oceanihabitans sp. 2_MG-2023]MDO6597048.1 sensor of ECF-type sigma factor [Oceanihabitans sp. 2_MG-2023]
MKKSIITLFILFLSVTTFSQNDRKEREDKIKALKVAYITENLNLSTTEAEKFWPVYNTYEEQIQNIRSEYHSKKRDINFETLSENEAQKLLDEMEALNLKRNNINDKYKLALRKVLSAKKTLLLKNTEDNFKRKMFNEYKKRNDSKN